MKKLFLSMFAFVTLVLVACSDDATTPTDLTNYNDDAEIVTVTGESLVGVSMPSMALERWERDGNQIRAELEALGFEVDLQFGQDDVAIQLNQIENMITAGVDILVIAPIDGETLTGVLDLAYEQSIPVIAYDRLIMNSPHISYYVTFDNFLVGQTQGEFLVEQLELGQGRGPFNIELFAGSPDDNNAHFFFDGAMSVLQEFIDSGELNIVSGQTEFTQVAIPGWGTADAQVRMDNLLSANYADGTELHAVLSPNDSLALGIVSSLEALGFGEGALEMPIVTGQDGDLSNVLSILDGGQAMTVFKDTRILAAMASSMVQAILEGTAVNVTDTETYDNGVIVVPTYLAGVVTVTAENVQEVLVESGFYSAAELGLE